TSPAQDAPASLKNSRGLIASLGARSTRRPGAGRPAEKTALQSSDLAKLVQAPAVTDGVHGCALPNLIRTDWTRRTLACGSWRRSWRATCSPRRRPTRVESPELLVERARGALEQVGASRLFLNPDCGFGTFASRPMCSPETAKRKLQAMVEAA